MLIMREFECFVPKHHIVMHLLRQMLHFGNPERYATWLDESRNKTLKQACKGQSQSTFERGVLLRIEKVLKRKV